MTSFRDESRRGHPRYTGNISSCLSSDVTWILLVLMNSIYRHGLAAANEWRVSAPAARRSQRAGGIINKNDLFFIMILMPSIVDETLQHLLRVHIVPVVSLHTLDGVRFYPHELFLVMILLLSMADESLREWLRIRSDCFSTIAGIMLDLMNSVSSRSCFYQLLTSLCSSCSRTRIIASWQSQEWLWWTWPLDRHDIAAGNDWQVSWTDTCKL